ncbi:UNVERIFIED_CONTAM: hypothetical protein Sradi_6893500 [Sesamum radiatum]|uniref:Reverse transcriptase/retrotransposon-derived protein RNase H-like domain-containing protein n=1 Tax=Sesamum radiatum TaxID=300843 RepID=A0AAW2JK05_SESRA
MPIGFRRAQEYLAGLPLLVKPIQGDTLYIYLSTASQAVSYVPIREEEEKQMPIYYVNKMLNGEEGRYTPIEKMAFALAQTFADFVSETTGRSLEDTSKIEKWLLHVDGSSTTQGSGAGIVITSPRGENLEFSVKFGFKASNNEAEYEGLVIV